MIDSLYNRDKYRSAFSAFGPNEKLYSTVVEKFRKEGYNAVVDLLDVKDNLTKFPIINLDKESVTITGKEAFDAITKTWNRG